MVLDRKVSKKTPTTSNNKYMINIEQKIQLANLGLYWRLFSRVQPPEPRSQVMRLN